VFLDYTVAMDLAMQEKCPQAEKITFQNVGSLNFWWLYSTEQCVLS